MVSDMKRLCTVLAVAFSSACMSGQPDRDSATAADTGVDAQPEASQAPKQEGPTEIGAPTGYTLTDKRTWETGGNGGWRAVLRRGDEVVDSIDVVFGAHLVGQDSIIYLQVRSEDHPVVGVLDGPTEHVLSHLGHTTPLRSWLPVFDDHFSSPSVVDRVLVYWGLERSEHARRLYAVRYSFADQTLDSVQLVDTLLETNNRGFLAPPLREGGDYVFESPLGTWLVSEDFATVTKR